MAAYSAGAAAVPLLQLDQNAAAAEASGATTAPAAQSIVAVGKGQVYADIVTAVVNKLGGMKAFVKPGDKVDIVVHPMKDGSRVALMVKVVTAEGERLKDKE